MNICEQSSRICVAYLAEEEPPNRRHVLRSPKSAVSTKRYFFGSISYTWESEHYTLFLERSLDTIDLFRYIWEGIGHFGLFFFTYTGGIPLMPRSITSTTYQKAYENKTTAYKPI